MRAREAKGRWGGHQGRAREGEGGREGDGGTERGSEGGRNIRKKPKQFACKAVRRMLGGLSLFLSLSLGRTLSGQIASPCLPAREAHGAWKLTLIAPGPEAVVLSALTDTAHVQRHGVHAPSSVGIARGSACESLLVSNSGLSNLLVMGESSTHIARDGAYQRGGRPPPRLPPRKMSPTTDGSRACDRHRVATRPCAEPAGRGRPGRPQEMPPPAPVRRNTQASTLPPPPPRASRASPPLLVFCSCSWCQMLQPTPTRVTAGRVYC